MKYPMKQHPKTGVIHYGPSHTPTTLCGVALCTPFYGEYKRMKRRISRIPKSERRYCKKCQKINNT